MTQYVIAQTPHQRYHNNNDGSHRPPCNFIFVTHVRHQKYLVIHKGDVALFEDEGKIGTGFQTTSLYRGEIWLNNEGSIGLKERNREESGHFV